MDRQHASRLSITAVILATAAIVIAAAGLVGASRIPDTGQPVDVTDIPPPDGDDGALTMVIDVPVTEAVAVSVVGYPGDPAIEERPGGAIRVVRRSDRAALLAAQAPDGRLVGLTVVPAGLAESAEQLVINTETTAMALLALLPGVASVAPDEQAAALAVAAATDSYRDLVEQLNSALTRGGDLIDPGSAVVGAVAAVAVETVEVLADLPPVGDREACANLVLDESTGFDPGVCVREDVADGSVEVINEIPRWSLLYPYPADDDAEACAVIPPAPTRAVATAAGSSDPFLAELATTGVVDPNAGARAQDRLRELGAPTRVRLVLPDRCGPRVRIVAAAGAAGDDVRATVAALLTVLSRHTAAVGALLGGPPPDLASGVTDDTQTVLAGATEIAGPSGNLDLIDLRDSGSELRNAATLEATSVLMGDELLGALAGFPLDADAAPVRLSCGECPKRELEPVTVSQLLEVAASVAGRVSVPLLETWAELDPVDIFRLAVTSGASTTTTPDSVPAVDPTTTVATGPRIERVALSISYPATDVEDDLFGLEFTIRNTGELPVLVIPAAFDLMADLRVTSPVVSADFDLIIIGPGDRFEGVLTFDPPPNATPSAVRFRSGGLDLEITL